MSGFLTPQVLVAALAILAALSVGGVAYALFFSRVNGASRAEQRLNAIAGTAAAAPVRASDAAAKRRQAVQESLREADVREKARKAGRQSPPLAVRLQQSGLGWSFRTFVVVSCASGLVAGGACWYLGLPLNPSIAIAIAGAAGFPRWFVNFRRNRRTKAFLNNFPSAVDVIVRGVKAGLPLNDCIRIVATEAAEPVRSEFRLIHERQTMGQTMAEAIGSLPERVPLPEANFFTIAISIQQQAGGSLSEALNNLAKVLRERAKMRGKIKAMAMEAKASAWIIGSLPVIVIFLVYLTRPDYIALLFTEQLGNVILMASALWMAIGVLVMRNMIKLDI